MTASTVENESECLFKTSCAACGSSDANAVYSDMHTHCFSCSAHTPPGTFDEGEAQVGDAGKQTHSVPPPSSFRESTPSRLAKRLISEETCRRYGYGKDGSGNHVATYRLADGTPVGQKIRTAAKDFSVVGSLKAQPLFGMHLWGSGDTIVITEGELDALSIAETQGCRFPVVSIPSGAGGAKKAIKANLEYLQGFKKIILCFDGDDVGRAAAEECAPLLPFGRVAIAVLPHKDASECLQKGARREIQYVAFNAKPWTPGGLLYGEALKEKVKVAPTKGFLKYPHSQMQEHLKGIRPGEIVLIGAGSGQGKTEFMKDLGSSFRKQGYRGGIISLEESPAETVLGYCGMHLKRKLKDLDEPWEDPEYLTAYDELFGSSDLVVYDSQDQMDPDTILDRMEVMVNGLGVQWIIWDHISISVASASGEDERQLIDKTMQRLRAFCQRTQVPVILGCHMNQPEGKVPLEEGAPTHLKLFRGSRSIGTTANTAIGIERNQQDPETRNITFYRGLKGRPTGYTGPLGRMEYDPETGVMTERLGDFVEAFDEERTDF